MCWFFRSTLSYLEVGPEAGVNALALATNNVNAVSENFIVVVYILSSSG